MRVPLRGSVWLLIVASLFVLSDCANDEAGYEGPMVCKGTKPLFVDDAIMADASYSAKAYLEPYWEQFYEHIKGCQIIIGNLIIPHMKKVPFELKKVTEAVKNIIEVTGFIYIYDVDVDIIFENLVVIHGNELLKYPWATDPKEKYKDERFALFFDRVNSFNIAFPALKYIKHGVIGFKDTPNMCAWKESWKTLSIPEWFDMPEKGVNRRYKEVVKIFKKFGTKGVEVFGKCVQSRQHKCDNCKFCWAYDFNQCQAASRSECQKCISNYHVYHCSGRNQYVMCCEESCRGGCTVGHQDAEDAISASCVACPDDKYLLWQSADGQRKRKCVDSCNGLIIEEANICLETTKSCPDYMFKHSINKCSYQCPQGMEFNPIADKIADETSAAYKAYWQGVAVCKPCRMRFVNNDFTHDCGIGCVLPRNSLSFFSILNVIPGYDDMTQWTHTAFSKLVTDDNFYANLKKCRHLYGKVKIDQYSVGYPMDSVRLNSRYFDMLTEATGLYGQIVVENTEGFWYVDMFRNLVVIRQPRLSLLNNLYDGPVIVQYNSDLRTLDLQRLKWFEGNIIVQSNPLYIPPREPSTEDKLLPVFKQGQETILHNGQEKTRSQKLISYNTGCEEVDGKRIKAYYYKRCVQCPKDQLRVSEYIPKWRQLFFQCMKKSDCKTERVGDGDLYFQTTRYGEEVCIKCNDECKVKCTDETPFTCYKDDKKNLECMNNMIDQFNLRVCAPRDCPNGFYLEDKKCVACHPSCRMCNGPGDTPVLNLGQKGCLGCGIIYPKFGPDGKFESMKCMNVGYKPRVHPLETADVYIGFKRIWGQVQQMFPHKGIVPPAPVRD